MVENLRQKYVALITVISIYQWVFLKDQSWVLCFSVYTCASFLCETNIINYPDDTTIYTCEPNIDLILNKLEKDTSTVSTWFQNNYLKANSGKSHLLTTSDNI